MHVSPIAAAVSLQSCPKELEGEYPNPTGPAPKNVPCFISSRGWGCEGGAAERPLFWSFVYVRSGSVVLGEQRSLGMLGLYSLGIKCSSVVCTVYSRYNYTVGHIWLETDLWWWEQLNHWFQLVYCHVKYMLTIVVKLIKIDSVFICLRKTNYSDVF